MYDGLGRTFETQQYEGAGAITVTTTYDALGQVLFRSNPLRPGDAVNGTNYLYDQLGRMKQQSVTQEQQSMIMSYSGNTSSVKDQASKVRTPTTDVGGRVTTVVEDPGNLNATTTYMYDPLDDLRTVSQSVQSRTFIYDGLRRFTRAVNPESGTTGYVYDYGGNLQTKTDGRGSQTNYTYDALNRVLGKSYVLAGGAASTPAVTYEYDRGTGFGIGQLDRVAAGVSTMTYGMFDALGRMGQSTESVLGNNYSFGYGYNLAGSLAAETYPSGRTVAMQYDVANRVTQVADTTVYVAGIQYAAQGGFQSYVYGNGLKRFYAYNQRTQPAEMTDVPATGGCAASGAGPTNQTAWALDLQLFWGADAGQVSTNNGDPQSQLIQTCNGAGYAVANNYFQGYSYDGVNRLTACKDENGADERDFN